MRHEALVRDGKWRKSLDVQEEGYCYTEYMCIVIEQDVKSLKLQSRWKAGYLVIPMLGY